MSIHPEARTVLTKLGMPATIKEHLSSEFWDIELSNNTNPYLEGFAEYPDVKQDVLKNIYLNRITSLNFSHDLENSQSAQLTSENLLFTVGSLEGIDILLRTFCEPNKDTVCVIHPTFSAYEHWALIHNLEVKKIPLFGDDLNTFSVDDVIKSQPKMVFLCNPNNPIGTVLKPELIEKVCAGIGGFVVVDEAYIEFADTPSCLNLLSKYSNLIILRTFSKAWGLAGVRCGVIMADKPIIHSLRYIQLPFSFSAPTQELVRQRLLYPEKIFASWQRIRNNREQLILELSSLEGVEKIFKSETNFIMLVLRDRQRIMEELNERKIHVLDSSASIPHSIRVSIGTEEQNRKFLEAMGVGCQRGKQR